MNIAEIRNTDDRYKQYPKFAIYCKDLMAQVAVEMRQVRLDNIAAEQHMRDFPRHHLNKRGYPHWDTHAARELLEVDVANKLHEKMKPQKLRYTRNAYKEFSIDVFRKRVNQEAAKQRAAKFWAHKSNKKGMKKYLEDVNDRAKR